MIDFWFTMGSTYTYLSATRLPAVQERAGVSFRWRPFHLLTILQEMKHVPFSDKPAKSAYMWRDIQRRAELHGLPVRVPAPYPAKQSIVANKVALLGMQNGWGEAFVRAAYRRWFQLGQEPGSEPNLPESLEEVGQKPELIIAEASTDLVAQRLQAETNEARRLGVFGSPTFAVDGELFWGDDRLEDAISWSLHRRVVAAHKLGLSAD